MPYDPVMIQPFRDELVEAGFTELRNAEDVDAEFAKKGTALLVVNSVCGCAAGQARPGVVKALSHQRVPDRLVTVFAGQDLEATARARSYFTGYSPSSPNVALVKDGKVVFMLQRYQIQGLDAEELARSVTAAFDAHLGASPAPAAQPPLDLPAARG
jgi:putative YphP/YqiW family bacilliredoxin